MPATSTAALKKEPYDIMSDGGEEAARQRSAIQRDLGKLEGKMDALLGSVANLTQALIRSDAERDNLAREVAALERKSSVELAAVSQKHHEEREKIAAKAAGDIVTMERSLSQELTNVKTRLYYLSGAIAAGGIGVGAAASKILGTLMH